MKRFFVLGFAPGKPEAVFDVIDGAFHGSSCFIGIVPFSSPTQGAWVHSEVFLRIDVHHSPTGRRCTGIVTMADTVMFPGRSIFFPFDVWAAEFITGNAAFEFAGAFRFQRKGSIIGAAGNAILVQGIILMFQPSAGIQRNIGFLKDPSHSLAFLKLLCIVYHKKEQISIGTSLCRQRKICAKSGEFRLFAD